MRKLGLLIIAALLALEMLPGAGTTQAQSLPPIVTLTDVSLSSAPTMTAYLSIVDQTPGSLGKFMAAAPGELIVSEDGVPVEGVSVTEEKVGLAVVVVLDSGKFVNSQGVIGTRWDDARSFVLDNHDKNGLISELMDYRLTEDSDWSGMVGVGRDITSVVALTTDQGEVRNRAYLIQPYLDKTPLLDGISRALDLFAMPDAVLQPLLPRMRKAVVVFSDGIDLMSKENEITDLINKAQRQGITYYTIGMASPGNTSGFDSKGLERLSAQTGGQFIRHDSPAARGQVLALFDRIATQRTQSRLAYQTHAGEGKHQFCVSLKSSGGQPSCKDFTSPVRMPRITLAANPASAEKGPGKKIVVVPAIEPTDGIQRNPKKVVYLVDGLIAAEVITSPFQFEWDVSNVSREGGHSIEARLYDSILPDTSYSSSSPITVSVKFSSTEVTTHWLSTQALALLLVPIVIALLILIFLMRRQIRRGVRATTTRVRAMTQILTPSKAKLTVVRGPNMGQEFRLTSRMMRIGRGEGLVDLVLIDPTVSNVHAILTEDQMGYSIADLGSANGTYVNNQPLPRGNQGQAGQPVLLRPGHVIRLGATELRLDRIGGTTQVLRP